MAVKMSTVVFGVVTPFGLAGGTLNMVVILPKTFIILYKSMWCHIPQDHDQHL
jgi:hypothetical protein